MSKFKIEDHTKIIQICLDNSFLWISNPLLKENIISKEKPSLVEIFESLLTIETIDKKSKQLIKEIIVQQSEISKKRKTIEIKNQKFFVDIMNKIDEAKTISELKNTLLFF